MGRKKRPSGKGNYDASVRRWIGVGKRSSSEIHQGADNCAVCGRRFAVVISDGSQAIARSVLLELALQLGHNRLIIAIELGFQPAQRCRDDVPMMQMGT